MFNIFQAISDKIKENSPVVKRFKEAAELIDAGHYSEAHELLERAQKTSFGLLKAGVYMLNGIALRCWSKEILDRQAAVEMLDQACQDLKLASEECASEDDDLRFSVEYEWANAIAEYGRRAIMPEKAILFQQAIVKYSTADMIKSDQPELYNAWGNVLWDAAVNSPAGESPKMLDEACEKFQRAVELDEMSAGLYSNWGRVIFAQALQTNNVDHFRQAEERFQRAVDLDPNFQHAFAGMGAVCSELSVRSPDGQAKQYFEKSSRCLENAVQLKPGDYESYYNLGNLYWRYGQREAESRSFTRFMKKGINFVSKSVEINEENADAYLVWGGILLEQAFRAEGEAKRKLLLDAHFKLQDAMNYRSNFVEAHVNQGSVFLNLAKVCEDSMVTEMLRKSCEHYRTAIRIDPVIGVPGASNNLLVGLFRMSERLAGEEKQQVLDEVIAIYETYPATRIGSWAYNVACAYMLKNDEKNVKKWLLIGEQENALETRHCAMNDSDLEPVRSETWFQNIRWRGEVEESLGIENEPF